MKKADKMKAVANDPSALSIFLEYGLECRTVWAWYEVELKTKKRKTKND